MELDVAAPQPPPRNRMPIGQREAKRVVAARLTVIAHFHVIGEPTLTVNLGRAIDMTRRRANYRVGCNASSLYLWTIRAMVDVGQMAPESAVLDPTCYTEGPSRTRRGGDPAATGHEVPTRAYGSTTGDISMRRGDNDVRNLRDHDVQGIDSDIAWFTPLLVDDYLTDRQRYRL